MVWIITLDVPSFPKSTLNWTFILLINKIGFEILECRFQFFIHFFQVSMQQYLIHSKKKTTTMTSKKVHSNVLLPMWDVAFFIQIWIFTILIFKIDMKGNKMFQAFVFYHIMHLHTNNLTTTPLRFKWSLIIAYYRIRVFLGVFFANALTTTMCSLKLKHTCNKNDLTKMKPRVKFISIKNSHIALKKLVIPKSIENIVVA